MKIKRISAVLLSLIMVLGLSACNSDNDETPVVPETQEQPPLSVLESPDGQEQPEEPEESAEEAELVTGRFDLSLPPDAILNGTLWSWVSEGTDSTFNGVDAEEFRRARYLIVEFAGNIDTDAAAGIAWQSANNWGWQESGFNLAHYATDDNMLVLPLYEILDDFTDFRDELPEPFIKIYFRYGDEHNAEERDVMMDSLDIQAVYFAAAVNF